MLKNPDLIETRVLARVRRAARRAGGRVMKLREDSRSRWDHGRFLLVDDRNCINGGADSVLDLADVCSVAVTPEERAALASAAS